jgi:glycosyltransferase involved in cell wall biosynthesis
MKKEFEENIEDYAFFSIIIPAQNEEKYIANALKNLQSIDYPSDKFEVIVVENGSTDNTASVAKSFKFPKVYSLKESGVSKAKNFGATLISSKSEWIIFLDADTNLKNGFLKELNYLISQNKNVVNIATSLRPMNDSFKARAWFNFYNFGRFLSQSSMSIQIVRLSIFNKIKFDEELTFNEDKTLIKQSKHYGQFFFLWTNNVYTSTRRFDKIGWAKQFIIWIWWNIIPLRLRRKIKYEAIR